MQNSRRGFTLIELLVVIAIIGILLSFSIINYISIRQRTRDAQRKSDIGQIQSALEMYRADYGNYPPATDYTLNTTVLNEGATYMQNIPKDPSACTDCYNGGNYYYLSLNNNLNYTLAACLENKSDSQGVVTSPGGSGICSSNLYYVKQNP
ncbi:MAG: prepilin-type N-terminal cleavage/methylation domain-containing protein [Candidatus Levyibacteriota bacterium]